MSDLIKPVDVDCSECGAHPGHYCPFPIPGAFAGTYDYVHAVRRDAAHALNFPPVADFDDEEKTPVEKIESMEEIMETLRSPGVPTLTSDKVTKPIRPSAIRAALER